MRSVAARILAHFCSVLIVLPVGWCCWLPDLRASEERAASDCCCRNECDTKPPTAPPAPAPTCCCDPLPALVRVSPEERPDTADASLPMFANLVPPVASFGSVFDVAWVHELHATSPPGRILHCVWLC
ncbi:MAG: hypothetical protein HYR84_07505 [Planctomycetes bacterium]|nr:hypothetical protein [Planctomycetota bacterium]